MIRRSWIPRAFVYALAATLAVMLPGCGGGGGSPTTPSTPAPVKTLLGQGNFTAASIADALEVGFLFDIVRFEITTSVAGTLEVDVDWTFPTSTMGLVLERSPCSFDQAYALQCTDVASSGPPAPKPGRVIVNNLAAGTYVFLILNLNVTASESGNYQVYLTH